MSEANYLFADRDFLIWKRGDEWHAKRKCSDNYSFVFTSKEEALVYATNVAQREGVRVIVASEGVVYDGTK